MHARSRPRLARTLLTLVLAIVGSVAVAPAASGSVVLEYLNSATFSCTGAPVDWTVPAGVSSVGFAAAGATGMPASSTGAAGGRGALVNGTLAVTPGETLHLRVGCSTGFNGGGGSGIDTYWGNGGGATDIRQGGDGLNNRVVVAAGGGGGGRVGAGGSASDWTGGNGVGGAGDGTGATPTGAGSRYGQLGQGGWGEVMVGGGSGGGGVYGGGGSGSYTWCDICVHPTETPGGGGGAGSSAAPAGSSIGIGSAGNGSLTLSWNVTGPTTAPTVTSVATSPNPSVPGDVVELTATVTSNGQPVTVGSVSFQFLGLNLTVTVGPAGSAIVHLSEDVLPVGTTSIHATYNPGTGYEASEATTTHTVSDSTGPVVDVAFPDPGPTGWFASPVGGVISATDSSAISSLGCSAFALFGMTGLGTSSVSASMNIVTHGAHSFTCTATDASGNSTTSPLETVRIDLLAPAVLWVDGPAADGAYELGSVPGEPTCVADDGDGSGPAGCSVTGYSDELGTHTMSATAVDMVGRSRTVQRTYTVVDTTGPAVDTTFPASPASAWFTGPVLGSVSASDLDAVASIGCSGATLASLSGIGTSAAGGLLTVDGEGVHTVSCNATDPSGNTSTSTPVTISIDSIAPTASWSGGPADASSYPFGSVPAAPSCDAVDGGSGPDGCLVTGYSTSVGTHVLTATATDVAGNTSTVTRTYKVRPWQLLGFDSPVDMGGVVNTVRGGSTVPLKFDVLIDGVEQTATSVVRSLRVANVSCTGGAVHDEIEVTSTGGTSLRYDATAGQFIYNWQTPRTTGCVDVTVETLDGSTISARFRLR